jgi:hypothetical protein
MGSRQIAPRLSSTAVIPSKVEKSPLPGKERRNENGPLMAEYYGYIAYIASSTLLSRSS